MVATAYKHIIVDSAGRPRVDGSLSVTVVAFMHNGGDSLEGIASLYSYISLEGIHEAWDYYMAHKQELDPIIEAGQRPPEGYCVGKNGILEKM